MGKGQGPPKARLVAYYLPQFHPIPENDKWWGAGFTEWTHVAKAKPLFRGHYQPRIPADLGFYDLRVPETRAAQAEMAREYGIEGFCYWHYWFGNGRRLLERPFEDVLRSGEPDFPFCLGWANASLTGVWYGAADRILVKQSYPGLSDYEAHFGTVLEAFSDERYMTVDEKPVFFVFRPLELPEPREFTTCWRELAIKAGLKGIHFVGVLSGDWETWVPERYGFDAAGLNNLQPAFGLVNRPGNWYLERACRALTGKPVKQLYREVFRKPRKIRYADAVASGISTLARDWLQYPGVMPNWDNTPRSGLDGIVFHDSNPEIFRRHLKEAIEQVKERELDKRLIVVKSWNEWAEGNYLEPDQRFGRAYLEVIRDEVMSGDV